MPTYNHNPHKSALPPVGEALSGLPQTRTHKSNRGFTLLETLVALAILAMGVVGVLGAFSSSMRATKEAELYSQASNLAAQVASQLDREETVSAGELSGTFEDTPAFSWVASVEEADSNNLMRTTITVTWGTETNPRNFDMVICLHPQGESTTQDSTTNSSSRTTGGG